jgi:hypothetical protein
MASPKQVGQSLRQVARALDKIADDAVREVAEVAHTEALRRGGTFGAKRIGAKVSSRRGGFAIVRGAPAGAWAIKSYGRVESVARGRTLGRPGGSFHAKRARAARGDKRWDAVVNAAVDAAPRVATEAVRKALRA